MFKIDESRQGRKRRTFHPDPRVHRSKRVLSSLKGLDFDRGWGVLTSFPQHRTEQRHSHPGPSSKALPAIRGFGPTDQKTPETGVTSRSTFSRISSIPSRKPARAVERSTVRQ